MDNIVSVRYRTEIRDNESNLILKASPWRKNLVLDNVLNCLARSASPAAVNYGQAMFVNCRVGDGNDPNYTYNPAITFTQTGTTLTASDAFFTVSMQGHLFKYGHGTGGKEIYIATFVNATTCEMAESYECAAPTAGTVWYTQRNALINTLYTNDSYFGDAAYNSATYNYAAGTFVMKRAFRFNSKVAPYNVNEIGWNYINTGTNVFGRARLPVTDVVGITNYYIVTIEITLSFAPVAPTAVPNVGTGVDTTGMMMMENFVAQGINSDGTAQNPTGLYATFSNATHYLYFITADYSQRLVPTNNTLAITRLAATGSATLAYAGTRGKARVNFNSPYAVNGETVYGLGVSVQGSTSNYISYDIKLNTPYTMPLLASYTPNLIMEVTFNRTLDNL